MPGRIRLSVHPASTVPGAQTRMTCWADAVCNGSVPAVVAPSRRAARLSVVERSVRDRGVGGSDPLAPTIFLSRSTSSNLSRTAALAGLRFFAFHLPVGAPSPVGGAVFG